MNIVISCTSAVNVFLRCIAFSFRWEQLNCAVDLLLTVDHGNYENGRDTPITQPGILEMRQLPTT